MIWSSTERPPILESNLASSGDPNQPHLHVLCLHYKERDATLKMFMPAGSSMQYGFSTLLGLTSFAFQPVVSVSEKPFNAQIIN